MISLYPVFYREFRCKADKCDHTCCQQWEIDIDRNTYEKYQALSGELGDTVRASIGYMEDTPYFTLNEDGYCHLLQNGLCRLVLEQGEDYLCNICDQHPRFYTYLEQFEFCGVGLACERSGELLMETCEGERDLQFLCEVAPDANEALSESIPQEIMTLLDICNELGLNVLDEDLHFEPMPYAEDYVMMLDLLGRTEPINQTWTDLLSWLQTHVDGVVQQVTEYISGDYGAACFNRLYQYILYRQLEQLSDYSWEAVTAFARDGAEFIIIHTALYGDMVEAMRIWSEQIEYSTDNVNYLLEAYEELVGLG